VSAHFSKRENSIESLEKTGILSSRWKKNSRSTQPRFRDSPFRTDSDPKLKNLTWRTAGLSPNKRTHTGDPPHQQKGKELRKKPPVGILIRRRRSGSPVGKGRGVSG